MLTVTTYNEAYYREHAEQGLDYAVYGEWQQHYGRWLVDSLGLADKDVLDVGCACGAIARGIQEAGAVPTGVDLNEHMIALGRAKWPQLPLHVCDAVNLHLFADHSFHAVHAAQVAEHWRRDHVPLILRELYRVTIRGGGVMFCALDTTDSLRRQNQNPLAGDPTHICIQPLSWWHNQFRDAGWSLNTGHLDRRLREHPLWTPFAAYDWDWIIAEK